MLKLIRTLAVILCVVTLASCKKSNDLTDEQVKIDDKLMVDFIMKNNITMTKDISSGIYYQVVSPSTGVVAVSTSKVTANYQGRLLDGSIFEQTTTKPLEFSYGQVIEGWQVGLKFIENKGKIRLLIPSRLAYRAYPPAGSTIPKNAVLDFTIEILDIQ